MLKSVKEPLSGQTKCICYRKIGTVFCQKCNNICSGRVVQICQTHPNCSFLYDRYICPNCKAPLEYLKEFRIDVKHFETEDND